MLTLSTLIDLGESMNYEITLPLASVNYPGPSKSIRILSSCVWFYNRVNAGDTMFFCYDSPDTFAFGLSSGTKMISKINHTISSSKYGRNMAFQTDILKSCANYILVNI